MKIVDYTIKYITRLEQASFDSSFDKEFIDTYVTTKLNKSFANMSAFSVATKSFTEPLSDYLDNEDLLTAILYKWNRTFANIPEMMLVHANVTDENSIHGYEVLLFIFMEDSLVITNSGNSLVADYGLYRTNTLPKATAKADLMIVRETDYPNDKCYVVDKKAKLPDGKKDFILQNVLGYEVKSPLPFKKQYATMRQQLYYLNTLLKTHDELHFFVEVNRVIAERITAEKDIEFFDVVDRVFYTSEEYKNGKVNNVLNSYRDMRIFSPIPYECAGELKLDKYKLKLDGYIDLTVDASALTDKKVNLEDSKLSIKDLISASIENNHLTIDKDKDKDPYYDQL